MMCVALLIGNGSLENCWIAFKEWLLREGNMLLRLRRHKVRHKIGLGVMLHVQFVRARHIRRLPEAIGVRREKLIRLLLGQLQSVGGQLQRLFDHNVVSILLTEQFVRWIKQLILWLSGKPVLMLLNVAENVRLLGRR